MAEHRLKYGKTIITRLVKLGQLLGYHSQREHPVNVHDGSAVDVAWFYEAGQRYPLFIFEIESKTSNTIPANPLKVFGETNQAFEKPLFLFHLLLKGGQDSSKVQQLERTYGTYNYRIYRFSLDEDLALIKDILSQHRRLTSQLNIVAVIQELLMSWPGIDIAAFLVHMEALGFEQQSRNILPSYAGLYKTYPLFREQFIRKLRAEAEQPDAFSEREPYDSYFGSNWSTPVYLALLSAMAESELADKYFANFKQWQEKSSHIKQIGPYFGLSMDYDLFILGMSGAVLGLIAALFYKVVEARSYLATELYEIIVKAEEGFPAEFSLINALWLLHICPDNTEGKGYFSYTRHFINANGGIPKELFDNPPVEYYGFIEGDESLEDYGPPVMVPDWEIFRAAKKDVKPERNTLFDLAIKYLTDPLCNWNPIIQKQL